VNWALEQGAELTAATIIYNRIFIYPNALVADFSIEISDIKNSRRQDGIGVGPASCHDP